MASQPLESLAEYSRFAAALVDRPDVEYSTVAVWSESPYIGIAEGEIFFTHALRLRIREELDFETGIITAYGHEAYRGEERLY